MLHFVVNVFTFFLTVEITELFTLKSNTRFFILSLFFKLEFKIIQIKLSSFFSFCEVEFFFFLKRKKCSLSFFCIKPVGMCLHLGCCENV